MGKFGRLVKSMTGIKKLSGGSRRPSNIDTNDHSGGGGTSAPMPTRADPKHAPAPAPLPVSPLVAPRDDAPASASFSSEDESPPELQGGKLAALLRQGVRIDASPTAAAFPAPTHASPTIAPPPNSSVGNLGSPFGSPEPVARAMPLTQQPFPFETTGTMSMGATTMSHQPAHPFDLFQPVSPPTSPFQSPFSSPDAFARRAEERRGRAEKRDAIDVGLLEGIEGQQTQQATPVSQTKSVDPETMARAVSTVQSYARGALARSETARKRATRRADLLRVEEQRENEAATRIQAMVRGVLDRRKAEITRRRRGGERRVAAIEAELAALRAAVVANAKFGGVPSKSPEIKGEWRRGGVDQVSLRSQNLLDTARGRGRPVGSLHVESLRHVQLLSPATPRFFTPETSKRPSRRRRGQHDTDDDSSRALEKETPSTSGSEYVVSPDTSSSSGDSHLNSVRRSGRRASVSKRTEYVSSASKHVSPGSRVVAAAEALAKRYHESPLWDIAGYDEPSERKTSLEHLVSTRVHTRREAGRSPRTPAYSLGHLDSHSSGASDGSSGGGIGARRMTPRVATMKDSQELPSWSPPARGIVSTPWRRVALGEGRTLETPTRTSSRPPWVGTIPPPSITRPPVARNANRPQKFEFTVAEDTADEVSAAEGDRGSTAASAAVTTARAYFATLSDMHATQRVRLGPVSVAAAFAVGLGSAAVPWVVPAIAPQLSAALGIEPAHWRWRNGGDRFGGAYGYQGRIVGNGQNTPVAALDGGEHGASLLLQLRLSEVEEKLKLAECALRNKAKNTIHEVDDFDFDEIDILGDVEEDIIGRRQRRRDNDSDDSRSRSRSQSTTGHNSDTNSDDDAFHSLEQSFDLDEDHLASLARERELELETKQLRVALEARELAIRDAHARAIEAEARVAEAENEAEAAMERAAEASAAASTRKNTQALDEEITRLRRAALVQEKRCQLDVERRVEESKEAHSADMMGFDQGLADAEAKTAQMERNHVALMQKLSQAETEREALRKRAEAAETAARDAEAARAQLAAATDGSVGDALESAAAVATAAAAAEIRALEAEQRISEAEAAARDAAVKLTKKDAELETLASAIRVGKLRARDAETAIEAAEARADAAEAQLDAERDAAASRPSGEDTQENSVVAVAEARREAELVRARLMLERDDALDAAEAAAGRVAEAERRRNATATALDDSKRELADAEARVASLSRRVDDKDDAAAALRGELAAATAAAAGASARAETAEARATLIEQEASESAAKRVAAESEASSALVESLRSKLHDTREALERANLEAARASAQRATEMAAARDAAAADARREAEIAVSKTTHDRDALAEALTEAKRATEAANLMASAAEKRARDAEAEATEATRVMKSLETDARAVALAARLKTAEEETRVAREAKDALERRVAESETARVEFERGAHVTRQRLTTALEALAEKEKELKADAEDADSNADRATFVSAEDGSLRHELETTKASLEQALTAAAEAQAAKLAAERARDAAVSGADPDVGGVVFAMRRERATMRERLAQAEEERSYFSTKLDDARAEAAAAAAAATRQSNHRSTLEQPSSDEPEPIPEPATVSIDARGGTLLETALARRAREEAESAAAIRAAEQAAEAKRVDGDSRRARDAETERERLEAAAKKRREDLAREQEQASRKREAELREARSLEKKRREEEEAAAAVRRAKEADERKKQEAARAVAQAEADELSRKNDQARVTEKEKKRLENGKARAEQEKDRKLKLEQKENNNIPDGPNRQVNTGSNKAPNERRGLGQTSAAGRKSQATRRAEATLAAAKQAWRRAETATARAKTLKGELDAAPVNSSERQRLTLEAAEAAEEARAAKQAWQEALGKAEESMEEAKKGRTEGKGEKDGAVEV